MPIWASFRCGGNSGRRRWRGCAKRSDLAPQVAGIRLNVGLVYYRQNDFQGAIGPFESVVRDVPDSYQARYLLGLCYFFNQRYAEAANTLEPLWAQASDQLNFCMCWGSQPTKQGGRSWSSGRWGGWWKRGRTRRSFIC